jgi:hypothetical protein
MFRVVMGHISCHSSCPSCTLSQGRVHPGGWSRLWQLWMTVRLQGLSGAVLDSAYVAGQVEAHQASIDRIRNQMIPAVQNAQLKQLQQQLGRD